MKPEILQILNMHVSRAQAVHPVACTKATIPAVYRNKLVLRLSWYTVFNCSVFSISFLFNTYSIFLASGLFVSWYSLGDPVTAPKIIGAWQTQNKTDSAPKNLLSTVFLCLALPYFFLLLVHCVSLPVLLFNVFPLFLLPLQGHLPICPIFPLYLYSSYLKLLLRAWSKAS